MMCTASGEEGRYPPSPKSNRHFEVYLEVKWELGAVLCVHKLGGMGFV